MARTSWKLAVAAGLLGLGGLAQAGLIPYAVNGDALVFDDDYGTDGLTWTANANLAASQTFGVSGITAPGLMTWDVAQQWIAAMNAANYGGASNWRLWSALDSDGTGPCGPASNCTDSELGHLFYDEGGLSTSQAITTSSVLNADLGGAFTNLKDYVYWSGTGYAPSPGYAWYFYTYNGLQSYGYFDKDSQGYGWAVRPGQVAAAPEPATGLLMALGLAGIGWARRGRRRLG